MTRAKLKMVTFNRKVCNKSQHAPEEQISGTNYFAPVSIVDSSDGPTSPALPVLRLSSLPPRPRSSSPACTTTARFTTLNWPWRDAKESLNSLKALEVFGFNLYRVKNGG